MNACHHFSALKVFADKGIRLTVCIFASDERAALASGAQIVSTLGDGADYLVISNPARFSSQVFFVILGYLGAPYAAGSQRNPLLRRISPLWIVVYSFSPGILWSTSLPVL